MVFKGALVNDAKDIFFTPGEHMQVGDQLRFTSVQEIQDFEPTTKDYICEAFEVEKAGLKVNFEKTAEYAIPEELQ